VRRRLLRALKWLAVAALVVPPLLVVAYRFVPVPLTPLMAIRAIGDGADIDRTWVPLTAMSRHAPRAAVAAEDNLFCRHGGFDWGSIEDTIDDYVAGRRTRGASTISMQTAKNVFLWPGRDFVRKGLEAYLTVLIELAWPKQRILEVYLNVAEWGEGVYGIEAAARAHFGKRAAALTAREAALLAVVLPNPREWSPRRPTDYVAGRARVVERRVGQLGELLDCLPR